MFNMTLLFHFQHTGGNSLNVDFWVLKYNWESYLGIFLYHVGKKETIPLTAIIYVEDQFLICCWESNQPHWSCISLRTNTFFPFFLHRFWAHIVMQYVFSFWTCYVLYKEYKIIATMRLHFIASENRRPDQFTVCLSTFILH